MNFLRKYTTVDSADNKYISTVDIAEDGWMIGWGTKKLGN